MRRFLLALLVSATLLNGDRHSVRVPVWMDAGDSAELRVKDFMAKVNGAPARVMAAHGPGDPLILILVLDLTEDLGLVEIAKEALIAEIRRLPPSIYVGLMRAQDGLRVLIDPTANRERLEESIRLLPVSGKAGLLDTIETAARLADSILAKAAVRAALLYVTDSSIYNYRDDYINPVINWSDQHDLSRRFPEGLVKEKISRLDGRLAGAEAPLFIVHLDYRNDRLNEAYQTGLQRLAATAGGDSAFCRSRQEVPEAISSAFKKITSGYSVDVQLPVKRTSKAVEVQLESGGRNLTYRNRFVIEE